MLDLRRTSGSKGGRKLQNSRSGRGSSHTGSAGQRSSRRGLPLAAADLEQLATRLKKRCGSGGTVNERTIEIQGDHRDVLVTELGKLGYTVRRSGG